MGTGGSRRGGIFQRARCRLAGLGEVRAKSASIRCADCDACLCIVEDTDIPEDGGFATKNVDSHGQNGHSGVIFGAPIAITLRPEILD